MLLVCKTPKNQPTMRPNYVKVVGWARVITGQLVIVTLRSYGHGKYGELPIYCWWTPPCKLRAFIWQFAVYNNVIFTCTTHHEHWFHYKHIFCQLIIEPSLVTFVHFPTFSSQMVNMDLHSKSPVHRWCSWVVKSIERNSPVMKRETPRSPVHMNTALIPQHWLHARTC